MGKRRMMWALVFGSMLAITGCGEDGNGGAGSGGSGGTGGSGGSGGTGGSAGTGGSGPSGPAVNTCEAFCAASCQYGPLDPAEDGYDACMSDCQDFLPTLADDGCGPEAEAFIGCCEDNACNCGNADCIEENQAWNACSDF